MITFQTTAQQPFFKLEPQEREAAVKKILKQLFTGSLEGAIAVSVILDDLGWAKPSKSPEDTALKNYAQIFLERLDLNTDSLATVIAMINNPVIKEK
jgi:hypothetical protein